MLHLPTFQCRTLKWANQCNFVEGKGNAQGRTTDANNHQKPSRAGTHKGGKCQTQNIHLQRTVLKSSVYTIAKWFLAFKIQRKKSEQGW